MTRAQWAERIRYGAEHMKILDFFEAHDNSATNHQLIEHMHYKTRDELRQRLEGLRRYLAVNLRKGIIWPDKQSQGAARAQAAKEYAAELLLDRVPEKEIKKLVRERFPVGVFRYVITDSVRAWKENLLKRAADVVGRIRGGVLRDSYLLAKNMTPQEIGEVERILLPIFVACDYAQASLREGELQGFDVDKVVFDVAKPTDEEMELSIERCWGSALSDSWQKAKDRYQHWVQCDLFPENDDGKEDV